MNMFIQCFFKLICPNHSGPKQWQLPPTSSTDCQAHQLMESLMNSGMKRSSIPRSSSCSNHSDVWSTSTSLNNVANPSIRSTQDQHLAVLLVIIPLSPTRSGISKENVSSIL